MATTMGTADNGEVSVLGRIKRVVVGLRTSRIDVATPQGDKTAWVTVSEGEALKSRVDADVLVTTGRHGAIKIDDPA